MLYNLDTSITDATLWHRKQAFGWNDATNNATLDKKDAKKRNRKVPVPLDLGVFILLEVTLQQTLQCLAVTGLVASHLVDGVIGCVAPQHWRAIFQASIRQV